MEFEPLVSIIINNYNYSHFLRSAIDSALNQTYPSVEVIVVDDGSTDNSCEVVSSYGNQVVPILKKNGGQASALNKGFEHSSGKIIIFLDSDDLFHPEKVKKIVSLFIQNNLINLPVIVHNKFEAIDKEGSLMDVDILENISSLQDREWKLLSKFVRDFHFHSFFDKPISEVCHPEQVYEFALRYRYIPYIGMPTSSISISRAMAEKLFPLPTNGCKVSADELIVKAASLIGKVYSANIALTEYRFHGNNNWYGKPRTKEIEELAGTQRDKYLNSKLEAEGRIPVFSFHNSMQAEGFYRHFLGQQAGDYLLALSFNVIKWHLDSTTLSFFLATFARGLYYKVLLSTHSFLNVIKFKRT